MIQHKSILYGAAFLGITAAGIWAGNKLFSASLPSFHKTAQRPAVPLSIGVVDINRIKTDSKVFQKFKEVVEGLNATIHEEIFDKETKLRAEFEHLKKREEELKEPTREILKQKTELDKKYAVLEETVRARRKELDEEYTKGLINIKQTLKEIMSDLGKVHSLKIILNKSIGDGNQMDQSIVLFCNEGLDLTDEVINRLDKQISPK
ncbi:MAG: OmpH family outer membrane protein [Candidatus Paracaedibacter sp.]